MKLLVTRTLPPRVMEACAAWDLHTRTSEAPMDADEAAQALAEHDAILPTLGDVFNAAVFEGPARARLLANFGVGTNHIDVAAARAAGVTVTNTPGAVTDATADIALTLILATCRRAGEGERMLRRGTWAGWHPTQLLGQHVTGKRLGIIGMGRIGKAIARRAALGFGMQVAFVNRSAVPDPGVPAQQVATPTELAAQVDILVVAVPATTQTHHLIDKAVLAALPPHAVFVNIARGDVVDEAALIDALRQGHIAGAGLDVYEHEPYVPEGLRALENVTLLPHLGTATQEVREAMGLMAVDNLRAFAEGRPPPNRV